MLLMPPHALKRVDTQLLAGAELVAVIGVLVHVVPDSIALVEVVVCRHRRSLRGSDRDRKGCQRDHRSLQESLILPWAVWWQSSLTRLPSAANTSCLSSGQKQIRPSVHGQHIQLRRPQCRSILVSSVGWLPVAAAWREQRARKGKQSAKRPHQRLGGRNPILVANEATFVVKEQEVWQGQRAANTNSPSCMLSLILAARPALALIEWSGIFCRCVRIW